ncbi:MAG: hypothetical protein F4X02_05530 [Chloroflexi bacterium]|nr:hypothetical protein [Chloroflexota bacterium]
MPEFTPEYTQEEGEDRLFQLAELLGLEFAVDDLAALARQLHLLDILEDDKLQDVPPILKMDADWHD